MRARRAAAAEGAASRRQALPRPSPAHQRPPQRAPAPHPSWAAGWRGPRCRPCPRPACRGRGRGGWDDQAGAGCGDSRPPAAKDCAHPSRAGAPASQPGHCPRSRDGPEPGQAQQAGAGTGAGAGGRSSRAHRAWWASHSSRSACASRATRHSATYPSSRGCRSSLRNVELDSSLGRSRTAVACQRLACETRGGGRRWVHKQRQLRRQQRRRQGQRCCGSGSGKAHPRRFLFGPGTPISKLGSGCFCRRRSAPAAPSSAAPPAAAADRRPA